MSAEGSPPAHMICIWAFATLSTAAVLVATGTSEPQVGPNDRELCGFNSPPTRAAAR